jgi:hypothetical protein
MARSSGVFLKQVARFSGESELLLYGRRPQTRSIACGPCRPSVQHESGTRNRSGVARARPVGLHDLPVLAAMGGERGGSEDLVLVVASEQEAPDRGAPR